MLAAAWKRGLTVCTACIGLLVLPRGSDAARRCDGPCGRLLDGPAAGDPVWPGGVLVGPMRFVYGTCSECRPWPLMTPTTERKIND